MGLFERELGYLDAERAKLVEREPICNLADRLAERFPDIFISHSAGYYVTVSFNVNAVRDMVPVLRWLADKGYRQVKKPEVSSMITWVLGNAGVQTLSLTAYFKEDGSCRKVKVGERATMVPVYEIQCGGKVVNDIADQLAEVGNDDA